MAVSVKADVKAALKGMSDLPAKQLPFTLSLAINDVAFQVQKAEQDAIATTFKHPRPFTQKSVQVDKAAKRNLSATVFIRPEVAKYLDPYEFGGVHVVPGAALLNPVAMRLDQYGQITQTTLRKLNALADDPKSGVVFATIRGIRGYWQRPVKGVSQLSKRAKATPGQVVKLKAGLKLLAQIEQPSQVHEHLDFVKRGNVIVLKAFAAAFIAAMVKSKATAR